jgi:hypothetical protein
MKNFLGLRIDRFEFQAVNNQLISAAITGNWHVMKKVLFDSHLLSVFVVAKMASNA